MVSETKPSRSGPSSNPEKISDEKTTEPRRKSMDMIFLSPSRCVTIDEGEVETDPAFLPENLPPPAADDPGFLASNGDESRGQPSRVSPRKSSSGLLGITIECLIC